MNRTINCLKCNSKIEDKFSYCPHCGGEILKSPFKQEVPKEQTKGIGWLGYLILFSIVFFVYVVITREGSIGVDHEPLSTSTTLSQNVPNEAAEADLIVDELTLDAAPAIGEESLGMRIRTEIDSSSFSENKRKFVDAMCSSGDLSLESCACMYDSMNPKFSKRFGDNWMSQGMQDLDLWADELDKAMSQCGIVYKP